MGEFLNTSYKSAINDLVVGFKERMKNPMWVWTDKQPTVVTYYKLNHEQTMLDNPTGLEYSRLSDGSPLRFNKIDDFFIYGLEKININLQDDEYGIESDAIEGEAIVLPNTIEPTPGDYFAIPYLQEKLLFRVNSVNMDSLADGANFWQISYKLDQLDMTRIDDQVVENYNMIIDNVGTKFKSVIKSSDYRLIEFLENFEERMERYYIDLFFEPRVETFVFHFVERNFYDPCMIEFLIRNNLINRKRNKYIHVTHQMEVEKTFSIEYDCSLFRSVELKDKKIIERIFSVASVIDDPNSIFNCRSEDYYAIKYIRKPNNNVNSETLLNLNPALCEAIQLNKLFREEDSKSIYNLIIKYFNNETYHSEDFDPILEIEFQNSLELYYLIPFYIYIVKDWIKRLLANI